MRKYFLLILMFKINLREIFQTEVYNIYNNEQVLIGEEKMRAGLGGPTNSGLAYFYKDGEKRIFFDYFEQGDLQLSRKWKGRLLDY